VAVLLTVAAIHKTSSIPSETFALKRVYRRTPRVKSVHNTNTPDTTMIALPPIPCERIALGSAMGPAMGAVMQSGVMGR
jgi:hypothetical protein